MRGVWSGVFTFISVLIFLSLDARADLDLACLKSKLESTGIRFAIDSTKPANGISQRKKDLSLCMSDDPKNFVVTYQTEQELLIDLARIAKEPKATQASDPRNEFLRCAFLSRVEKATERAADDFVASALRGDFVFSTKDITPNFYGKSSLGEKNVCQLFGESTRHWKTNDKSGELSEEVRSLPDPQFQAFQQGRSLALTASGSTSDAVQCFVNGPCVAGCASAQQMMSWRTLWHVYDFDDDRTHEKEQAIFDEEYPAESCTIMPYIAVNKPDEAYKSAAYYTKSPFHSMLYEKNGREKLPPAKMAKMGKKLLAGAPVFMSVLPDSVPERCRPSFSSGHTVNSSQNMTILSTSTQAMEQVMSIYDKLPNSTPQEKAMKETALKNAGFDNAFKLQFEKDYHESSKHLFKLSDATWDKVMALGKNFTQASPTQREAILHDPSLANIPSADREHLKAAQAILDQPFYRDTKIYLHPYGKRPLSFVMAEMTLKFVFTTKDPSCSEYTKSDLGTEILPVTMVFQENNMPFEQFDRFKSAIVKACTSSASGTTATVGN